MNADERAIVEDAITLLTKNEGNYSPNLANVLAKETVNKMDAVQKLRELCAIASSDLTVDEYQEGTGTTAIYPGKGTIVGLMYAALGLGESGEVQNKVKKILRDSGGVVTEEARAKIASELGDLLWYVGQMCSELGISMGDVARENLAKLADRKARGVIKGDGDKR